MWKPSESRKSWLGKLTDRYHEALDEKTLSYLEGRGIDQDAANGSRLGLVTDPDPSHTQFEGRLSIPFITPTGVVYMRFRCLEDHNCKDVEFHGKYEGPSGEEARLYNVSALHSPSECVGVCEGELDAVVASASGLPSVGIPGATNFKPYWSRLFEDYERVILLGDGDTAGRAFVTSLQQKVSVGVPRPMPKDHDVSSFVTKYGAEAFMEYALG